MLERYHTYRQQKLDLRASAKDRLNHQGLIYNETINTQPFLEDTFPLFTDLAESEHHQEDEDTPLPTFQVVGLPKAGTSQLYRILKSHPNVSAYHPTKEFCVVDQTVFGLRLHYGDALSPDLYKNEQMKQAIYKDVIQFYKNQQKLIAKTMSVNGCLSYGNFLSNYHYFGKKSFNSKILFLFRDPADWLWATLVFPFFLNSFLFLSLSCTCF